MTAGERVVVAMSGGVDSSVAAYLLKSQGYEVVGMTMKVWPTGGTQTRGQKSCCGTDAVADARRVAEVIDIPYYVMDMVEEFNRAVIDNFVAEYRAGRTPNPCVRCNIDLKFGALLTKADAIGASKVATGHYATLARDPGTGRYQIFRSRNEEKDQSYALHGLTQDQLARALFPLEDLPKPQVRAIAARLRLPTAFKTESQDICFVTSDYREFLAHRPGGSTPPGEFVDATGTVLGHHEGISHYTVGQRRGLKLATGQPTYVVGIDAGSNRVIVGSAADLMARELVVSPVNWLGIPRPSGPLPCLIKIRYGGPFHPGIVEPEGEGVRVWLHQPHRAVTPGQSAVFYDEHGLVLGGGLIQSAGSKLPADAAGAARTA